MYFKDIKQNLFYFIQKIINKHICNENSKFNIMFYFFELQLLIFTTRYHYMNENIIKILNIKSRI